MWSWKPVGNFCDMEKKNWRNKVGRQLWALTTNFNDRTNVSATRTSPSVKRLRFNVLELRTVGCWLLICNVVLDPTKNNVSVLCVCHMNLLPVSLYISTWEEENVAAVWRSRLKWPKLKQLRRGRTHLSLFRGIKCFSLLVTTQTHKHDLYTCVNVCNGVRATGLPGKDSI